MSTLRYFEETVSLMPEKKAVDDGTTAYTFSELRSLAIRGAAMIRKKLGYPDSLSAQLPIGVLAPRCSETILLFLAVLYSGHYYVPLNPELPENKLQGIIGHCRAPLVLGREADLQKAVLDTEQMSCETLTGAAEEDDCGAADISDPDRYLYMVYTSGSTGEPKGVLKTHRAMNSFLEAYTGTFDFSAEDVMGNQTPFFFDASAKDIYLMMKTGMTMEIIPKELFSFPPKLIRFLNEKKVTFISWVPSALCFVTQLGTFREVVPETLKKVFFVGETFPMKQFQKWQEALPDLEYANLYGASELAGISCYYLVSEPVTGKELPVGIPLKNCNVFLADLSGPDIRVITEAGQTGEILIQSEALASGYFEDPERTDQAFFELDGVRTFRSGDIAYYDEEGLLHFTTRSDTQIKHMGYRIELGEIEKAANMLPDVEKSCCLYNKEKRRIVLFLQMKEEKDGRKMRNMLEGKLADYMVPQKVIIKNEFPMNANGKTDRQKLKEEI